MQDLQKEIEQIKKRNMRTLLSIYLSLIRQIYIKYCFEVLKKC